MRRCATLATVMELGVQKPGNVSPAHPKYPCFLDGAVAIADPLGRLASDYPAYSVGSAIGDCVQAMLSAAGENTHLGTILLFAPLTAASKSRSRSLRGALSGVLSSASVDDAVQTCEAIQKVRPAGLTDVADTALDVRNPEAPREIRGRGLTLVEWMTIEVEDNAISGEYGSDYQLVFEMGLPHLLRGLRGGKGWSASILQTFLILLSNRLDTLILGTHGRGIAQQVSLQARDLLGENGVMNASAVSDFDRQLTAKNINPGTTADLVVTTVFAALLSSSKGGNAAALRSFTR